MFANGPERLAAEAVGPVSDLSGLLLPRLPRSRGVFFSYPRSSRFGRGRNVRERTNGLS
jgi:hypothetical protein